jgi:hypothetical protein
MKKHLSLIQNRSNLIKLSPSSETHLTTIYNHLREETCLWAFGIFTVDFRNTFGEFGSSHMAFLGHMASEASESSDTALVRSALTLGHMTLCRRRI